VSGGRRALRALAAWAVHFFVAYGLMLALPNAAIVGWLTLGLGLFCLAFLAWNARSSARHGTVMTATIVSALAIVWQSIVAFF
jgi:hypothetical protein